MGAAGPQSGKNHLEIKVANEAEVGGHLWTPCGILQALH